MKLRPFALLVLAKTALAYSANGRSKTTTRPRAPTSLGYIDEGHTEIWTFMDKKRATAVIEKQREITAAEQQKKKSDELAAAVEHQKKQWVSKNRSRFETVYFLASLPERARETGPRRRVLEPYLELLFPSGTDQSSLPGPKAVEALKAVLEPYVELVYPMATEEAKAAAGPAVLEPFVKALTTDHTVLYPERSAVLQLRRRADSALWNSVKARAVTAEVEKALTTDHTVLYASTSKSFVVRDTKERIKEHVVPEINMKPLTTSHTVLYAPRSEDYVPRTPERPTVLDPFLKPLTTSHTVLYAPGVDSSTVASPSTTDSSEENMDSLSEEPLVYSSTADIFQDPKDPWNPFHFESVPSYISSDNDVDFEEKKESLIATIAEHLSSEKAQLARLAVAFAPPTQSMSLKNVESVEVIALDGRHIQIGALVCEENGCVSVAVPVSFQTECSSEDCMEECLMENIGELDVKATQRIQQMEASASFGADFKHNRAVLTTREFNVVPSWWVPPLHLSDSCTDVQNLMNEQDFQHEIQALALLCMRGMHQPNDDEDWTVEHAMVTGLCPSGLTLRAIVKPINSSAQHDDTSIVDLPYPFGFEATSYNQIRDTILGAVDQAIAHVQAAPNKSS